MGKDIPLLGFKRTPLNVRDYVTQAEMPLSAILSMRRQWIIDNTISKEVCFGTCRLGQIIMLFFIVGNIGFARSEENRILIRYYAIDSNHQSMK